MTTSDTTGSLTAIEPLSETLPAERELTEVVGAPARRLPRPVAWVAQHSVFLLVFAAGVVLRLYVGHGFSPALIVSESKSQLAFLNSHVPAFAHPSGYALFELLPLSKLSVGLVLPVLFQHVLGLATGVVMYALLLRWGVWRWLAGLATIAVLLDPMMLVSEHLILPDSLFIFLVTTAVAVLGWRRRPGPVAGLVAGLLLGVSATVLLTGQLIALVALVAVLAAGGTWRQRGAVAVAGVIGFAAIVAPYASWYHVKHNSGYTLAHSSAFIDSLVAGSPSGRSPETRPLTGLGGLFDWSRAAAAFGDAGMWRFRAYEVSPPPLPARRAIYAANGDEQFAKSQPTAGHLVAYQRHINTPGLIVVGLIVLGGLAAAGIGRARESGLRVVAMLTVVAPTLVLLVADATGRLSARHLLLAFALLPLAGAIGLTALMRGARGVSVARPQSDLYDRRALDGFATAYGNPKLGPVVVVIAAYNEAAGLPQVVSELPTSVCGLGTHVLVVDDGSTDGTADALAGRDDMFLVTPGVNRGQGAALRLGYRVAREHGARYIITTDADGQYDTADFPRVLQPILRNEADFVTGSRRRGHQETKDRVRRTGTIVFAWIISAMTGRWVTDTSFGLRAMRAEVTAAVTLNQPQYQSSELMLGVFSHGFRVLEVPAEMHIRSAGSSKKGRNLVYGSRYARVVFGTWWREACPRPVREVAPAMADERGESTRLIEPETAVRR